MIQPGTILVEGDAQTPPCFRLGEEYPDSWMGVHLPRVQRELEAELAAGGWTFFYFSNSITAAAFGFQPLSRETAALKGLFAQVRLRNCNCLEIDRISQSSWLGVPRTVVAAHPRHIQKGLVFSGRNRPV